MNILITGASGLIGTALKECLEADGHKIFKMERKRRIVDDPFSWWPENNLIQYDESINIDIIINLAGENISSGRWTKEKKNKIYNSRINSTRLLSERLAALAHKPELFISASAIGYYGDCGDEIVAENHSLGSGFLPQVCKDWEAATSPAEQAGIRAVKLRLGIVMTPKGGMLEKIMLPFKLGLGGKLGNGRQFMSWICLEELCHVIEFIINNKNLGGAFNIVSPKPIRNSDFTKSLGKALHRPTIFTIPKFILKLLYGEMADEMLLASTRAIPKKLENAGYQFIKPEFSLDKIISNEYY